MRKVSVAVLVTFVVAPLAARAQDGGVPHPPAHPPATSLQAQLASPDAATVKSALDAAALAPTPAAVTAIGARIREGLPPDLLDAAIDALGIMHRPDAAPILAQLVSHRRAAVRKRAIEAIAVARATGATSALVGALDDVDPTVRGAAATSLTLLRAVAALPQLFEAYERGVPEAASAVGQLARQSQLPRILAGIGTRDFALVSRALDVLLHRDDITIQAKREIVTTLSEHDTAEVRRFFQQIAAPLPYNDPLRAAIEAATAGDEDAPDAGAPSAAAPHTPAVADAGVGDAR